MLTAHLPSGYCLAHANPHKSRGLLFAALIGAVIPDIDMLFFLFVDHGRVHHHNYWPHVPFFWLVVAVVMLPLAKMLNKVTLAATFLSAVFLHLILDTIAGGIMWLYPLNDALLYLVTVPAVYSNWILSFILHWTFIPEIAIWIAAAAFYLKNRNGRRRFFRLRPQSVSSPHYRQQSLPD